MEDTSIWISRLSEEAPPLQGIIQSIESSNRTEKLRKSKFALSLLELGQPFSPALRHLSSWSLGVWTWTELHHQLSWFSSLQTADCGTSQPP